jgi:hypothetical protein
MTLLDEADALIALDRGTVEVEDVEADPVKVQIIKCETHDLTHQGGAETTATFGGSNEHAADKGEIVLARQHQFDVADHTIGFDGGQLSEFLGVADRSSSVIGELVFGEWPVEARPSPLEELIGCRNRLKHEWKVVLLERA